MILTRSEIETLSGIRNINEARRTQRMFSYSSTSISVFLSHKHSDRTELQAVKKILEDCGARPYVDWLDQAMPDETIAETAIKIKQKIDKCGKFIFIATDAALHAPWCNWEIGYGDSKKLSLDAIALFAIKENERKWSGNEYLQLYPVIEYEKGFDKYTDGNTISKGYYVNNPPLSDGTRVITPLKQWLLKK